MKRFLTLLICVLMLLSTYACTPNIDTSNAQSTSQISTESTDNTSENVSNDEKVVYSANVPEHFSWEKEDFIILTTAQHPDTVKYSEFGFANEDMEKTVLNDAVLTRNDLIADKYGVTIIEDMYKCNNRFDDGELVGYVERAIDSGTGEFSIVVPSLYHVGALAKKGLLYNLNEINTMSLESEWWDRHLIEEVNVMDKLFFITGDIGFTGKDSLNAVFFNKELISSLGLDNPYQLAKDMKWTIDVMYSWAKLYSRDLDNDGKIGHLDIFGIGGQADNFVTFLFSSGEQFAALGDNNMPVITIYNERSSNIVDTFQKLYLDEEYFVSANNLTQYSTTPVNLLVDAFVEGRSLFFYDGLYNIEGMRKMDVDFGILPIPLYEESQERYRSLINPWTGNAFAIAANVDPSELEDIATIMNILGAEGKNLVTPAYIETTLKGQRLRDDESEEMLDIIFDNIGCDIGMVYCFGRPAADVMFKVGRGENFTTIIDSNKSKFESDIKKFIDIIEQLD